MTYEWINFDYSNPLFNEPSIPISGGGIPIYGTDDLEVLNYDWCNSVPSSDLVEIYTDQYESTIRFINPNDTETHRTVNVEGVALRACHEDLGEYWKVFLKHPSTPFAHYEFRGNDANDKLEISGEISAFNSYSLESEDYFGHNYFHGGAGFDTIKVEGSRKNFSLSDGDKQYDNETGRPYYRFELEQNQRRSLGGIPGFSISLMSVEQIIFDDETIDLPGAIGTPAPVVDPAQPSGSDNAIGAGAIVQNITNIYNNTNNNKKTIRTRQTSILRIIRIRSRRRRRIIIIKIRIIRRRRRIPIII